MYEWRPRFARAFVELRPLIVDALARYATAVRTGEFPAVEPCYAIEDTELGLTELDLGYRLVVAEL